MQQLSPIEKFNLRKSKFQRKDFKVPGTNVRTKITGLIGNEIVISYIYPGSDASLNHYIYQGETYPGTIKFTTQLNKESIPY